MERKKFLRQSFLSVLGTSIAAAAAPVKSRAESLATLEHQGKTARNIIFMVSDGMSTGTLNMADMLMQRKLGKRSTWLSLYDEQRVSRALMDTASASSLVTDSAAASSSWGGGVRVPNGSLNVSASGEFHQPIWQKFKAAGKAVGCVTTVPVAHATPAGFCVNNNKRGNLDDIAVQYLDVLPDLLFGGGRDNFTSTGRKDKRDLLADFQQKNYRILSSRAELLTHSVASNQPSLGLFYDGGLPYSLDRENDSTLQEKVPTLAEMTRAAIAQLSSNPNGFALQVEAGKVDWAAHANDIGALLYDQLAFDEAVAEAIAFAMRDRNTLVIITTDHGNANPGLFYGSAANANFDRIQKFRHTNEWLLNNISRNTTPAQLIDQIAYGHGMVMTTAEASKLLEHYEKLDESGVYNARKLPFRSLAEWQTKYSSVGWGSMDHSADFVELALYGPGSALLKPFVKNTDLHNLMLRAAGVA